jgi:hypothetical protein
MPTFIKAGFWDQRCEPCNGYKGWLNLDTLIKNVAGTSGTNGSSGTSGTSGLSGTSGISGASGDRYQTTSSTSFTLGTGGTITVGTGLAYTIAQDILISYNISNHQVSMIISYNPATGVLVFDAPSEVVGSGTYTSWGVNLNGAAGGNGSNGTSGTSGVNGTSGTSGTTGTSGSSGTRGTSGTSGLTGSSGTSGLTGSSGTSGVSPVFPLPLVYGLYAQTANSTTVTNTTTETTIIGSGVGTLTVGANQFVVGDSFRADIAGLMSAQNNQTLRVKIKAGSVILADSGPQNLGSAISSDVWALSINFTVRALGAAGVASMVSLGTFTYIKTNNATIEGFSFNTLNSTTFDTTISNVLGITVEWGSANAGNTIYSDTFVLNKIY